eukprot:gene8482-4843_t
MPGLTKLEILSSLGAQESDFCWSSALVSVEDMRPAALLNLALSVDVHPRGELAAVLRLLPQLQAVSLWDLQDSDAEALAGLSNLTQLELGGDMELTRRHHLPVLKHLSTRIEDSGVPLEQLDRLIGGSSSLRKVYHFGEEDERGVSFYDGSWLNISAMPSSGHGISTALQSVSLALQQCSLEQLRLDYRGYGAGARRWLRLDPQVGDALAPLAATLEHLYLADFIVDKEAVQSIAQHLLQLRTLCVSSCKIVAGSRAALDQAGIALELTGDDNEGGERVVEITCFLMNGDLNA